MITVKMTAEESDALELLFYTYNANINILATLLKFDALKETDELFNKKWNETVQYNIDLERMKDFLSKKYQPDNKTYDYEFSFIDNTVIYYAK